MERLKQQVLVLALMRSLADRRSWCGETHIQKCVYFLENGVSVPLDLEFVLYKHGPFSFELRKLLGEMRANLLIEVRPQPYPYGPTLVLSNSANDLVARFPQTVSQYSRHLDFVADKFARRDVVELERLSTALYVAIEEPNSQDAQRVKRITELKPHVSADLARQAIDEINSILTEAPA